jgi:hypothetical protein
VTDLPELPGNSRIKVERLSDGVELSWLARPHSLSWFDRALDSVGGCLAWACAGFWLIAALGVLVVFSPVATRYPPVKRTMGLAFSIVIPFAFLFLTVVVLARRRRAKARTILALTEQDLVYTPPDTRRSSLQPGEELPASVPRRRDIVRTVRELFDERPRFFMARDAVRGVAFEGREHFGTVSVKGGDSNLDVGRHLSAADRRWLAEVLRRWRDAKEEGAA